MREQALLAGTPEGDGGPELKELGRESVHARLDMRLRP
jgi:hypothetical protein